MSRIFVILMTLFMFGGVAYVFQPDLFSANGLKLEDFLKLEEIHNYQNVAQNLQAYIEKIQGASKKVGCIFLVYYRCLQ